MGWLLDLVERLTVELVPPVPSSKSMREPLQPAQAMAVPSVPSVPPQKSKVQNEFCFSTPLTATGQVWLSSVADLLECEPADLLERGFIDHHDLVEQCGIQPRYAARLIRSHPEWPHHHSQDIQIQSTTTCGLCPDNKKKERTA